MDMGPGLVVTDEELRSEAVDLILTHEVIEVMRTFGYNPEDTSGADVRMLDHFALTNRAVQMAMPCGPVQNLFRAFDSHWHNKDFNPTPVTYVGSSSPQPVACIGTEVNYYFEGVLFRTFGFSLTNGMRVVQGWKRGSGHGKVTANIEFFFKKGWSELPSLWPRVLQQYRTQVWRRERVKIRKDYMRSKQQG